MELFIIFFLGLGLSLTVELCLPDKVIVHTFGDSHSHWHPSILSKVKTDYVLKTHSFYGKTMYGAVKHDFFPVMNFKNNSVEDNSIVMFNFGEVDSRNHLHRFSYSGLDVEIRRLVDAYEQLILLNLKLVPTVKIWIGGLVPTKENPTNEHIGSNEQRKHYNYALNSAIFNMARRNNFFFLDNFKDYVNEKGYLKIDLSDGHIHIGREKFTDNTKTAIANEINRIFCGNKTSAN